MVFKRQLRIELEENLLQADLKLIYKTIDEWNKEDPKTKNFK